MYHFSVCSSIKLLPYGIWTLTSNLQQLISSSKNFFQKEVIQNSKKRLWMSYKWNIRLRLMPAGSFFQTNGLLWKHCVFYLEMISLGYLQFWYAIPIKQKLKVIHRDLKQFIVVLKFMKSQCTYHIFSLKIQFYSTLSPHCLVSLLMATLSQVLFFCPTIPSPSQTWPADGIHSSTPLAKFLTSC